MSTRRRVLQVLSARPIAEGLAVFPLDMLRYDSCWPRTERDVTALTNHQQCGPIKLCRLAIDGADPSFKRWASFGWRVDVVTVY